MNVIEFIRYKIGRDGVRMIDVDGTTYYSATDIDNILDVVDKEAVWSPEITSKD